MSVEAGQFDPANWQSHYAAVRARLTKVVVPVPKLTKTHFVTLRRRVAAPVLSDEQAAAYEELYLSMLARSIALVERKQRTPNGEPTLEHLLAVTAEKYGLSLPELIANRRDALTVSARHEYMWRAKKETSKSLGQIGKACGNRDHTTVLHGLRVYAQRMSGVTP